MVMTALPAENNTAWYTHYSNLHSVAIAGPAGMVVVASNDAPDPVKIAAHFVCDGINDEVQINDAIDQVARLNGNGGPVGAEQRGVVQLTGGTFEIDTNPILMRTGVWLRGMGVLTEIKAVSMTGTGGSGTRAALIKLNDTTVHLAQISNMWLNGNYAAGGACDAIAFAGGGSHSSYPDTNPDPDNIIRDLYISQFKGTGSRYGIYLSDDLRGTQLSNLNIRGIGVDAIYATGSPDSHMNNIHIGTCGGSGVNLSGGNWKVTNTKAYYCDAWGFNFANSRLVASCIESQDNFEGIRLGGNHQSVYGALLDNHDATALEIAGNFISVGATIFHRTGGRYGNTNVGVEFTDSPTDVVGDISIDPANITATRSGTQGARGRGSISNGSTVYTW